MTKVKTCYIVGAGDCETIDIKRTKEDMVIAADNGLKYCEDTNIEPDIIVGDFDSLGYVPQGENVICLPVEKDDTDMFFAVKKGFENGYDRFVIYGGTGGDRPEHTYANISLLAYISKNGGNGFLVAEDYVITAITDSKVSFNEQCSGNVSVFSFSDYSYGVCEKGLKYSLDNKTLVNSMVLGISNSFMGKESYVSVEKGTLIIYFSGTTDDASV